MKMTTDRELLQQALDAFEKIVDGCRGVKSANPMHESARDLATFVIVDCREPIKSISARLAQREKPDWSAAGFIKPRRGWRGLTTQDKREIINQTEPNDRGYVMALVEAKLKGKNIG